MKELECMLLRCEAEWQLRQWVKDEDDDLVLRFVDRYADEDDATEALERRNERLEIDDREANS